MFQIIWITWANVFIFRCRLFDSLKRCSMLHDVVQWHSQGLEVVWALGAWEMEVPQQGP